MRWHVMALGIALLLTLTAYITTLDGRFVYDDVKLIVENPDIQRGENFWTGMTTDLWAFRGEPGRPGSHYWRPVSVAWSAMNYQLFGLEPAGWHATSIALHFAVTILCYCMMLRLGFPRAVCAVVAWIFAVHPVHVESVAWASGIGEVLVAAGVLGSYLCYLMIRTGRRRSLWLVAVVSYALALLSKEAAIIFPILVFGTEWILSGAEGSAAGRRFVRALSFSVPFGVAGAFYLTGRLAVLGSLVISSQDRPSIVETALTAPAVWTFYLRQSLFPAQLSPFYPLDAVGWEDVGLMTFVAPIAIAVGALASVWWLSRRDPRYGVAGLWFAVPLILPLYIRVFPPWSIVQDRYLYLASVGPVLIVVAAIADLARLSSRSLLRGGAVVSVILALQCMAYGRVWHDNLSLFEHAAAVVPNCSHPHEQLGYLHRVAGRTDEAKRELQTALRINPNLRIGLLNFGLIAVQEKRFDEAEAAFRKVLDSYPDDQSAIDPLLKMYIEQERYDQAFSLLDTAVANLPHARVKYTVSRAVLLKRVGRKDLACQQLEGIREALIRQNDPVLARGLLLLGDLHRNLGQEAQAASAFREFLTATEGMHTPQLASFRRWARQRLADNPQQD